jgi:mannan endo-1,4-beta-mannosidase
MLLDVQSAAAQPSGVWTSRISENGSSFTTMLDGRLEFILMDGWVLNKISNFEYMITKEINGQKIQIGGIEVLSRDRAGIPSNIFTSLKDSGGSYILIEDKLIQKDRHSQYHIKWIKDKRYNVDIYVMNSGAVSYHIALSIELKNFENVYQQFEDFIHTLDIRDFSIDWALKGYYNNLDKYMIYIPDGWEVDNSREFAATVFQKPGIGKLYIYKQQLNGISPDRYIGYSNKKVFDGFAGFQVIFRRDISENGVRLVEYMWRRPEIDGLESDFNYYWETNIIPKDQGYVYTYTMKTNKANIDEAFHVYQSVLKSFQIIDYDVFIRPNKAVQTEEMPVSIKGNKIDLEIPAGKTLWGVFTTHNSGVDYLEKLKALDRDLGHKFEFVMTYYSLESGFPEQEVRSIYDDRRVMMLTLQPWRLGNTHDIMIPQILEGKYDQYIKGWAEGIKKVGEPVFVRFANEMNGDWDPWCAWFFGKDHDLYIEAWKRVHNIFREVGADNAYFVWNPHDRSFPDFKWNDPHLYYPGDQYVDWIGMTGYNNGTSHPADTWREFDEIYSDIYNQYKRLYPDKPLMITEFSSNEVGGNKEQWIRTAFKGLAERYKDIRIAVWFDQVDGKWQYPISSSPGSKRAFIEGLKQERYNFSAIK